MPDARQKRLTLVACILGSAIVFIDGTVVNVALPAIREDLNAGLATQQWVMEAYLLMLGSLILIGGSLSDLFGRRRVFTIGVVSFGVTSALCAVAPTAETLVAARGLQGMAGALLVPSALATIIDTFPEDERGAAIGSWTAWGGVSTLIGPVLGGVLIEAASWRLVFALSLVPVAGALYLIRRYVPEHLDRSVHRHVDVAGAVLCAIGLAGIVLGLIEQPKHGWGGPLVAGPLAIGAVALVLFVAQERRARDPMLPLGLFRRRNFAIGNLATLALYSGLGAATFFLPVYLQQVADYRPVEAGLSLLPVTIVMFALSRRFGALADRFGPRLFMAAGPLVAACGLLLLLRAGHDAPYLSTVFPAMLVFGLGLSITVAPLTAAVLAGVEDEHAGIASGVNNAIARVAGLLAIGVVGAVVAAQFGATLDERVADARLDGSARAAVERARSRPLTVADGAPAVRAASLDASVEAFRAGMAASALLAAFAGLISAVGIENPRRRRASECPGGAIVGASRDLGRSPVPAASAPT
ncbi:MAG TPA: MFS transporter [Thermoleophilaceae bacterium]|nr:MFS transporter [Thermoleophilaceae bacterium]